MNPAAFHRFLAHPSTAARLDAALADNRRVDRDLAQAGAFGERDQVPQSIQGDTPSAIRRAELLDRVREALREQGV